MLTVRDHTAIRLASATYRYEGARETDVHRELDMTITRFRQFVNTLLDRPDVEAEYPMQVRRLRRLRDQRRSQRSTRRIPA